MKDQILSEARYAVTSGGNVEDIRQSSWIDAVEKHIGRRFSRADLRRHAILYLYGLLEHAQRKNSCQLAEVLNMQTPYAIQHLLNRAVWDANEICEDLRDYVVDNFGDSRNSLFLGEAGFVKKGDHSAAVQRQFNTTTGRIENCQIGLFMAYGSVEKSVFIDRELYVPREWSGDLKRCDRAGIPKHSFRTKSGLAQKMVERAYLADVPFNWVIALESAYGDDSCLIQYLEKHDFSYVLAISQETALANWKISGHHVTSNKTGIGLSQLIVTDVAPYLWTCTKLPSQDTSQQRWLLARRRSSGSKDVLYYIAFAPQRTSLPELARIASQDRVMESSLRKANFVAGMNEYKVRNWCGWYRHVTLAMLAYAYQKLKLVS